MSEVDELIDQFKQISVNDDQNQNQIQKNDDKKENDNNNDKVDDQNQQKSKADNKQQQQINNNQPDQLIKKEQEQDEVQNNDDENKIEKQEHTIIKGTQRSDGTMRKDVKIRAGYKNAEMIQRYVIPQKRK